MEILIKQVENGLILTYDAYSDLKDCEVRESKVYETEDNPKKLIEFLYDLLEILGENMDGFAKETINISLIHGDEYFCENKNCEICTDNNDKQ